LLKFEGEDEDNDEDDLVAVLFLPALAMMNYPNDWKLPDDGLVFRRSQRNFWA
jgi:hypothetical protein